MQREAGSEGTFSRTLVPISIGVLVETKASVAVRRLLCKAGSALLATVGGRECAHPFSRGGVKCVCNGIVCSVGRAATMYEK